MGLSKWGRSKIRLQRSSINGVETIHTFHISKKMLTFHSTIFSLKYLTQSTWESCDPHTSNLYIHLTVSAPAHAFYNVDRMDVLVCVMSCLVVLWFDQRG